VHEERWYEAPERAFDLLPLRRVNLMCRMIQVRKSEFQRILQYGDILYNKLQVVSGPGPRKQRIDQRSPFRPFARL